MKTHIKWFSLPLVGMILLLLFNGSVLQENIRLESISQALLFFTENYPQQKVYLHTDRDVYRPGEDIWLKAYLINGTSHQPDSLSENLFVELVGPDRKVLDTRRLKMFNGYGRGDLTLPDTLPSGLYQIRAYTSWMRNFNSDYYFSKNLRLQNPGYKSIISPEQAKTNIRELKKNEVALGQLDVQFMPEGGNMVYGLESVVAFKAVNGTGYGVDITGEVFDNKNRLVASFSSFHKGMGTFSLTPVRGMKYYAIVSHSSGKLKVALPKPLENGIVMQVTDFPEKVDVNIKTSRIPDNTEASQVMLVAQVRGVIYYYSTVRFEDQIATLAIGKDVFPPGIVQLTLFTSRGEPVAERLFYSGRADNMKLSLRASEITNENGKMIELEIESAGGGKIPAPANLSLSVVRYMKDEQKANNEDIISYTMLSSDLTGIIEDPSFYFAEGSREAAKALDNLLLTQGWRRFDWTAILEGSYPETKYFEEHGIAINGLIQTDLFGIPIEDALVTLTLMDEFNDVFTQNTGANGYFNFDRLDFYDTASVKIEAWRKTGRRNLVITVEEFVPGEVTRFSGDYDLVTVSERDNRLFRQEQAAMYDEALKKKEAELKDPANNRLEGIHPTPDYVLNSDRIPSGMSNIIEVLNGRVPGLNISGDNIMIRGPNSFYSSTQPLFLVDNVPVSDIETIKSIPLETIDRVEILKGGDAAIYGVRGGNGVIAIYTKRGRFIIRGVVQFDITGYSYPRSLYVPKYTPENEPDENYTVMWIPEIKTSTHGTATVWFSKPEIPGDYRFVLEGMSSEGLPGRFETIIENLD